MNGFRKWALAAYLVLSMYLLARPSSEELTERARALDVHLQVYSAAALAPALAAVLGIPAHEAERHLQRRSARPSDLVFDQLLAQNGCPRGDDPASELLESGVSMHEAVDYFDAVEKQVDARLRDAVLADARPVIIPRSKASIHGKPAN